MPCDFDIYFGDTTETTITGSGTEVDPIIVNLVTDPCTNCTTLTLNADGSVAVSQTLAADFTIPAPIQTCQTAGPGGLTATAIGAEFVGCQVPGLGNQHPEQAGFLAATFPPRWRQYFTGGENGDELWVVLPAVDGSLQWHPIA